VLLSHLDSTVEELDQAAGILGYFSVQSGETTPIGMFIGAIPTTRILEQNSNHKFLQIRGYTLKDDQTSSANKEGD